MKRSVPLVVAVLSAAAGAAAAQQQPAPAFLLEPGFCSPDPRYRCADYDPRRPLRVVAAVGSHVTLQLAEGGKVEAPAGAMLEDDPDKAKEWHVSYADNVIHFQALRDDMETTNVTVPLRMPDRRVLLHPLELNVRKGTVALQWRCGQTGEACADVPAVRAANRDNMGWIEYQYPTLAQQRAKEKREQEAAVAAARAKDRRDQEEARAARGDLRQAVAANANRQWRFTARGNKETEPLEISHDGTSMLVRYDANGRRPQPYILDIPDGEEGVCDKENEARAQFDTQGPGLMQIHGVFRNLCFRNSQYVTQVKLVGPKPESTLPLTGTISPRVVRGVRGSHGD